MAQCPRLETAAGGPHRGRCAFRTPTRRAFTCPPELRAPHLLLSSGWCRTGTTGRGCSTTVGRRSNCCSCWRPGATERECGELTMRRGAWRNRQCWRPRQPRGLRANSKRKRAAADLLVTNSTLADASNLRDRLQRRNRIITPGTPQPLPMDTITRKERGCGPSAASWRLLFSRDRTPRQSQLLRHQRQKRQRRSPLRRPLRRRQRPCLRRGLLSPSPSSSPGPIQWRAPAKVQPNVLESIALADNGTNDANFVAHNACNKFVEAVASALGDHTFPSDANADRIFGTPQKPR